MFFLKGGYATEAFEDVGHSTDARDLMKKYLIGHLVEVLCSVFVVFVLFYLFCILLLCYAIFF